MTTRLLAFLLPILLLCGRALAAEPRIITIGTARSALVLVVAKDGRVHQLSYGRNRTVGVPEKLAIEDEVYPASGSGFIAEPALQDRKSTRLNSSHSQISYAVFCLKKKKRQRNKTNKA